MVNEDAMTTKACLLLAVMGQPADQPPHTACTSVQDGLNQALHGQLGLVVR